MQNDIMRSSVRPEDLEDKINQEVITLASDIPYDMGYVVPTFAPMLISDVTEDGTVYAWDDFSDGAVVIEPGSVYLRESDLREALDAAGKIDADLVDEEFADDDGFFAAHARPARGDHAESGCSLPDMLAHTEGFLCCAYEDGEVEAFIPVFHDTDEGCWCCLVSDLYRRVEDMESDTHIIVPVGEYERATEWVCAALRDRFDA